MNRSDRCPSCVKHESSTRPSYDSELRRNGVPFRYDKNTVNYELERWEEENAVCKIFQEIRQKRGVLLHNQDDMFKVRQKHNRMGLDNVESFVLLPHLSKERQCQREIKDLETKLQYKMASRPDFQNKMVQMSIEFVDDIMNQLNKRSKQLENELLQEQKKVEDMKNERDSATQENKKLSKHIDELKNSHQMLFDNFLREKNNVIEELFQKNDRLKSAYQGLEQYVYGLTHPKMIGNIGESSENSRLLDRSHKLQTELGKQKFETKCLSEELVKEKEVARETEKEFIRIRKILNQTNEGVRVGLEVRDGRKIKLHEDAIELRIQIQKVLGEKIKHIEQLRHELDTRKKKELFESSTFRIRNLEKEVEKLNGEIKSLREKPVHKMATANLSEQECIRVECIRVRNLLKLSMEENKSLKVVTGNDREKIYELEIKVEQLLQDKNKIYEDLRIERESRLKTESHENSRVRKENKILQNNNEQLHHEIKSLKEELMHEKESAKLKENEYIGMQKQTTEENIKKKNSFENSEYQKLRNEVDQLHRRNQSLEDELIREKEKVQSKEKDIRQMMETQRGQPSSIQAANGREKLLKESNVELKNEIQRLLQQNNNLTEKLRLEKEIGKNLGKSGNINLQNQNAQKQLEETRDQLKHVQRELDDTKSRLSRAMGDKLTDNNPNIADLSDKNRPTKISERYQELYDNQWTDAFEIINETCLNEENTINVLRSILMDTLEYCKEQAANQMIQIKQTFLKGEELPANLIKQVKECRKATAELYGKGLYKDYCTKLSSSDNASLAMKTPNYVKECFEICWLMAVQDPPVVFGPQIRRSDVFNKDQYKAYTKSGESVEFVVWPVLLLHQDGPVLCKGVAQGK